MWGIKNRQDIPTILETRVQNQGMGRAALPLQVQEKDLPQVSLLASGNSLSHGVCVCVCMHTHTWACLMIVKPNVHKAFSVHAFVSKFHFS